MVNLLLTKNKIDPFYIQNWWIDQMVLTGVKLWYWPAFVAGISDNVVDLLKPQTYSICRV